MRDALLAVTFLAGVALCNITYAQAINGEEACASLQRPNIDCACVAQRIAAYNELSPNAAAVAVIDQGYLYAL
ncbi:hypothetical protein [Congregibacter litoralis]|uniref:Bifunctional inhibitor/plant lipid transfer protein/seed storage helical domain-containing protein n=1 Tax=Congregibacter litoralis KT71 TaxID=314285 RepID=A4A736_9GAMM|nr:hypothetical protein [Congregibacter litoralis]EAQ98105.1 hypothetical protein KT71_02622 [Congregibacter litoralis KT71]